MLNFPYKKSTILFLISLFAIVFALSVSAGNDFGDIHSDGKIDTKDVVKLAQYVADWDINLSVD